MPRARRGRNEGSIFKRKDGRWVGRISLGFGADGKRKTRTVYGKTKKEAQTKLGELKQRSAAGTLGDLSTMTVAQFLARWLADEVKPNRQAKTAQRYEGLVDNHINKAIGGVRLQSLNPAHVLSMLSEMERGGDSADCRLKTLRALKTALNWAVSPMKLITANPCQGIKAPKVERREIQPLDKPDAERLFKTCKDSKHRLESIFVVATMTGLRRGELFALKWSDINLAEGVLSVRRTLEETKAGLREKPPKTKAGRRAVPFGSIVQEALQRRKVTAEKEAAKGHGSDFVFPDRVGGWLRGSNFSRGVWATIRQDAKLPTSLTFHDLRHTHASLLIKQNVHIKTIQERLGHANIQVTLDTYSHLLPGMQAEAADQLDAMFRERTIEENETERKCFL
jgi:integrase